MGADEVQSQLGTTVFAPGTADGTVYQLATLRGGERSSVNSDGGIRRATKASVGTASTTIYSGMSFGELITVTGLNASGPIFADLLMASYNTVAVISSNAQQGSPAARTYSAGSGDLNLAMASGTYDIIVQSLVAGAQE